MFRVLSSPQFQAWVTSLRDKKAKALISSRIARIGAGLSGDVKIVATGILEARIHYGPGYRVYFTRRGQDIILILAGGDKSSQDRDIEAAIKIRAEI
jgi:putative addiction module killer protein